MSEEKEVWSVEEVTCPYCECIHDDSESIFSQIDGSLEGEFDFECWECEREFRVSAVRAVTFTSTPKAGA